MKKLTWTFFAFSFCFSARSQWTTSGTSIYNTNTGGYVGIGTSTPNYLLSIIGNSDVFADYYAQNINSTGETGLIFENNRGSLDSYGILTLGGTADMYGNAFGLGRADRVFVCAGGANNLGLVLGTSLAQPLVLGTNDIERMRVNGSGNIGMGTTEVA